MEVLEGGLDATEGGCQGGHGGEVDAPALDAQRLWVDLPEGLGNDDGSVGANGTQVDGGVVVLGHDRDETGAACPRRRDLGVGLLEGGGGLIELDGGAVVIAVLQRGHRHLGQTHSGDKGVAGTEGSEPEHHSRGHGGDDDHRGGRRTPSA